MDGWMGKGSHEIMLGRAWAVKRTFINSNSPPFPLILYEISHRDNRSSRFPVLKLIKENVQHSSPSRMTLCSIDPGFLPCDSG